MEDFKHYCPSRRNLNFRDLHQEQSDEFYEIHFGKLVIEVYAAAERTFCPIGQHRQPKKSPWLREYSNSFYKYAQALANPDLHTGHWDRLLRDREERTFLLSAMIMKILDTHVLSSLLFGADPEQMKLLQSLDASFVNAEGFTRSKVRAEVNSLYLKTMEDDVPPRFWQEVDKITTRLVTLLLPVYSYTAESYNWEPPAIESLYQSLHEIVAYAGWLNASIRLSPGVIFTEWILPGERTQMKEENLSREIFEHSKAMVRRAQNRLGEQSRVGLSKMRVARIKISVAPKIIRHAPRLTDYDGEEDVPGTSSYTVMKPHVVYYQGRQKDSEERALYVSLPDYVQQLRNRKKAPYIPALIIMLVGILIVSALHVDLEQWASAVWTWFKQSIPVLTSGASRTVPGPGSGVKP